MEPQFEPISEYINAKPAPVPDPAEQSPEQTPPKEIEKEDADQSIVDIIDQLKKIKDLEINLETEDRLLKNFKIYMEELARSKTEYNNIMKWIWIGLSILLFFIFYGYISNYSESTFINFISSINANLGNYTESMRGQFHTYYTIIFIILYIYIYLKSPNDKRFRSYSTQIIASLFVILFIILSVTWKKEQYLGVNIITLILYNLIFSYLMIVVYFYIGGGIQAFLKNLDEIHHPLEILVFVLIAIISEAQKANEEDAWIKLVLQP